MRLALNSLREPLESGFQRDAPIRAEHLNPHFNRGASTTFEGIPESLRFLGRRFSRGSQFSRCRATVFDLDTADHRRIFCRRIAEFGKQPLPAGGFRERELGAGVDRTDMVPVSRVRGQREDRPVRTQTKESVKRDLGDIHSARVTA
jgi:hypothetical protein